MALIIVLSVFNGFEGLVISLFNSFDPPLKVTPATGKTFSSNTFPWEDINKIQGVKAVTKVIEEKALLKYGTNQFLASLKGVDDNYLDWTGLDSMMTEGSLTLKFKDQPLAVAGMGVAYYLGINLNDYSTLIEVYAPKRSSSNFANPESAFQRMDIRPAGFFSIQQDFDIKYVIVPISFTRELFEYDDELTAVEISVDSEKSLPEVQATLKAMLCENFIVKNRFQQQEMLYKIMHSEKFAIFLILSFILLIATFNMVGSLSMLILEKRKDIAVLYSLGADNGLVRKIFITEGLLIVLTGAVAGIILGTLVCIMQQQFGFVKINAQGGSFLITAYPVDMYWKDFVNVIGIVTVIGLVATLIPVSGLKKIRRSQVSRLS